ncbi:Peroxidase 65 [Acorus calamus]|uniref:Peroxidase 65 n=1 Tax=Acorus calamus TaxID=4465 RepID=A0AAV9D3C1_ACOCL|nr:Peroxidase 65 [Acorus calamus]
MNNTAPEIVVFNDVTTPEWFDNAYYGNLKRGYGLLSSDQNLYLDDRTKWIVESMIYDESAFFDAFASAMEKLGTVGVKTGRDGEVRLQFSSTGKTADTNMEKMRCLFFIRLSAVTLSYNQIEEVASGETIVPWTDLWQN